MSQGGGAAGAAGGGGGGKFLEVLKTVGIPVGLGAVASASPLAAVGVRTGLGAYDMLSERRRQKKLSELMAEYYGRGAGERVEAPSNAGDPAFGGEPGKFSLGRDMGFKTGRDTPTGFGLGGGDRPLSTVYGESEPPMTAGASLDRNKISQLLSSRAAAPEQEGGGMSRSEYLAKAAASGAFTPAQLEQLEAQETARRIADQRYQEGLARDDARYEDTKAWRDRSDQRAQTTTELAQRAADRADEALELQRAAAERAERVAGVTAGNLAADNARAERAAELAEEKFELEKSKWETSQQLDAKSIANILNSVNGSLDDLEWQMRLTSDPGEKEALTERVQRFAEMRDLLQSKLEQALGTGQTMPMVRSGEAGDTGGEGEQTPVTTTGSTGPTRRRRYNAATGRFE